MDLKKNFGRNVQKYRKLKKMTQEKLAELAGIDVTSVSAIETGKYFVSAENLSNIAQALNVKVSDLFYFDNISSGRELYNDILNLLSYFKDDIIKLNAVKNFIKAII